jgi:hypothetical protein
MAAVLVSDEKVRIVRGRTKDKCWRNYVADQATKGGILPDVLRNRQEAYEAMKRDNETGI